MEDDLTGYAGDRQVTLDCQFAITTSLIRSDLNESVWNFPTSGKSGTPQMKIALRVTRSVEAASQVFAIPLPLNFTITN
jgi:hypothetical protein